MKQKKKTSVGRHSSPWRVICISLWASLILFFIIFEQRRSFDVRVWETFFDLMLRVPVILMAGLGRNLLLTIAIWFQFFSVGSLVYRWLKLSGITRIEERIIAAGMGAGVVSLALLGLGAFGFWNITFLRELFFTGLMACVVSGFLRARYSHPAAMNTVAVPERQPWRIFQGAAVVLILLAVVMNILATTAPELSYDSLIYHLALPKLYLLHGRIIPTPQNMYSGIPFGIEMFYGLALALSNENLAALLHCSFGIATALAIWAFLRRCLSNSAGVLAVLLYYMCPLVLAGSWHSGIDIGVSFYLMLFLSAISLGLRAGEENESSRWHLAGGVFIGFAMGVKYTVLPVAAALVLAFFWLRLRSGRAVAIKETVSMSLIAGVLFAPWLVKNFFFYGNPLYPFLHQWLGRTAPADWAGFLGDARSRNLAQTFGSVAGWNDFVILPWTLSLGDRAVDDWLGAAFLIFTPWAFACRWGLFKREDSIPMAWTVILLLTVVACLVWSLSSTIVRFLMIALPFAACLMSLAIVRSPTPNWLYQAAWVVAILSSMYNFQEIFKYGVDNNLGIWSQVLGKSSRSEFLKTTHASYPAPYYSAMEYIDQHLPLNAKVLFLGESRGYYCNRDYIAATVFDNNPFWIAARESTTPGDLAAKVRSLGITHIFLNTSSLYTYVSRDTVAPRDVIGGKVFGEFWNQYLEKIFDESRRGTNGGTDYIVSVYRLRDKPVKDSRLFPENMPLVVLNVAKGQGR